MLGVSEPSLYKILKSQDGDNITIGVARRISSLLNVAFAGLFEIQEEVQPGNTARDSEKRPDEADTYKLGREKEYGGNTDELYISLVRCESEREMLKKEQESYTRELDSYKALVEQQSRLIERLSAL